MNYSRNITDLPLEVLGLIFKKLPTLLDKVCLAQVHPHFGLALSCYFSQEFKTIDSESLDKEDWPIILPLCGSSVERIQCYFSFDDTISKLVKQHCPNLQSIKLTVSNGGINGIKSMLATVRSLRSIELFANPLSGNRKGIIDLLKLQPNLRSLDLDFFTGSELLEVGNLVNLEKLIIGTLSDINIQELCFRLKKLRTLKINCKGFSASEEVYGEPCPALTKLDLRIIDLYKQRRQNEHCPPVSIPGVLNWIFSHANTLEILKLDLGSGDYEPTTVICQILSDFKNLSYLKAILPVGVVDNRFAHRLPEIILKKGVASEKQPLKLKINKQIYSIQKLGNALIFF